MVNRLPSKSLLGRRVRVLHSPQCADGSTGVISTVDTETGAVGVVLERDDRLIGVNWADGDRWMVIPVQVPVHPAG